MSTTRGVRYQYRSGESVLCFEPDSTKAKVLYDAKVLDISVTHDKIGRRQPAYLIHFLRWNSSWDRVVPESYLLKNTDDNRVLMRKLTLISQKESGRRRNKARSRKIERALKRHFEKMLSSPGPRDVIDSSSSSSSSSGDVDSDDDSNEASDDEETGALDDEMYAGSEAAGDDDDDEPASDDTDDDLELAREAVRLDLSAELRHVLDRDRRLVKVQHRLVSLPASPNVASILESYVKNFAVNAVTSSSSCVDRPTRLTRSGDDDRQTTALENNVRLRKELVDGLRVVFDFTLPLILLYDVERSQYQQLTRPPPVKLKLEVPAHHDIKSSPAGKSSSRSRQHHGRKTEDRRHDDVDTEVVVLKAESVSGRQSVSARRSRAVTAAASAKKRRRRPSVDDTDADDKCPARGGRRGRLRQRSLVTTTTDRDRDRASSPPLLLAAVNNSITSSSRTSSPERPLPHLTAAVIPHHQRSDDPPATGFPGAHQPPDVVTEVLGWKLVPDEYLSQQPRPPSLIYGAQHLLRLFVRLPGVLDRMYIPQLKLSHLVRHLSLFIQYLADHSHELFVDSAYSSTASSV